jgi:hypothetical protein
MTPYPTLRVGWLASPNQCTASPNAGSVAEVVAALFIRR